MSPERPELTVDLLLRAYSAGVFPMADDWSDPNWYWVDPELRGILPLDQFHLPRSLRKIVRHAPFDVRVDTAFRDVVLACAQSTPDRPKTWINPVILAGYQKLFALGHAHSVECWHQDRLVGGLYGVSLGAAFFGESMFSRVTDASKVALVHLVGRLKFGGFRLLDTQFVTSHLATFGAIEVPRDTYLNLLDQAISTDASFYRFAPPPGPAGAAAVLQAVTQTS